MEKVGDSSWAEVLSSTSTSGRVHATRLDVQRLRFQEQNLPASAAAREHRRASTALSRTLEY
jgi:hypothetical protein